MAVIIPSVTDAVQSSWMASFPESPVIKCGEVRAIRVGAVDKVNGGTLHIVWIKPAQIRKKNVDSGYNAWQLLL